MLCKKEPIVARTEFLMFNAELYVLLDIFLFELLLIILFLVIVLVGNMHR